MKFKTTELEGSALKEKTIKNQEMIEHFRVKVLEETIAEIEDEQQKAFAEIASVICAKMLNEYLQERVRRGETY